MKICSVVVTLILLTWRIGQAPNNASKWQMGFNSVFKRLKLSNCQGKTYFGNKKIIFTTFHVKLPIPLLKK
jgi:hypothetical protein